MDSISPAVYLIPPLMGVAAYLALHNVWIWHGRRSEPLHLWVSLWCANSLLYLASHFVQIASGLPEHAVLGGRLAWTSAIVLVGATLGLTHALAGVRLPRRLMWPVGILNAGLLVLVWLTDVIVSDEAYVRTDLLGYHYGAPVPGPLLPLLAPYILAVFAYAWRTLGRGDMDAGERQAIRAGLAVYIVLALNDMLHAARLIQSIRVFDLGFVAVGVGLTYMLVRRYNRLYAHLEAEVSVRSREAHARAEELAALLRAGQSVLAGLDLKETLDRIVSEASRIAGTRHVKLLLVDREARALRVGAAIGGTVPLDFTVSFGGSYSGTIAATGEPLFVADTQNDPRNLLAQRDREQGIRTFLGLPVKIRDEVLGVLTFNTEPPHEYSPGELQTLLSFAGAAALAISNARLHEGLARRLARVETLTRVSRLVSASLERDAVLREISRSAALLVGVPVANFWLADGARRTLDLVGVSDPALDADWPVRTLSFDQGTAGWVATHRRPLNVPDASADVRPVQPDWWRARGLTSYHGVPVLHEGSLLGVLSLLGTGPIRVEPEDEALLEAFAAQAAVAIQNASLYESARAQARELEALHEVRTALVSTLDLPSVLEAIAASAMRLAEADGAAVFELDAPAGLMLPRTSYGWRADVAPLPVRLGQGAAGTAALRREPVWSEDIRSKPFPGYDEAVPGTDRPLGEAVQERPYRGILGAPLLSRGTVFGAICLYWAEPHAPDEAEIRRVTAVAQQAAVAIEHAQVYRTMERRLERLETLRRLGRTLSSSLERDAVLTEITESAAQLMQVRGASFWLADEAARTLTLAALSDPALEADLPGRARSFDEGLLGWIATHRRQVNVPDVFTDARFLNPAWWQGHGLTSFFGAPVVHAGLLVGVLAVAGSRPIQLDAEDGAVLGAFLAQAAVAMQNASLYESARAQGREIGALHDVGAALASSLDLHSVLGAITASALELTGAGGASVFELEPAEGVLHLRSSRGIDETRTPKEVRLGQGAAGAAALRREPVWSPDVSVQPLPGYEDTLPGSAELLGEAVRAQSYRGLLGVPLVSGETVFGAICLYWYEPHAPEDREIRLLTAFARQAAVALEHARLYARLARRLERVEALARLNRTLSSSLNPDTVLGMIARSAAHLMGVPATSFWRADEQTRTIRLVGSSDPALEADWASRVLSFDQGVVGWVATHRKPLDIADGVAEGRFVAPDWWLSHGLRSFHGVPVLHEGSLLAVLALNGSEPFHFDAEDEALLSAFVAQAAVAIGNASLYDAEGQARRASELALAQVKQLHGMLPICAYCKKIRDDSNYWQSVESYIGQRSAATFSHGICPDCKEKIVKPEMERWKRERGGQP